MSSYLQPCIQAFEAEEDLSGKQFHFVKFGSDEGKVVSTADGESAIGVVMNAPELGGDAEVSISGGALVKLSGPISAGALIASDANGAGDAGTTADKSIAKAHETGVAGDVIKVVLGLDAVI